MLRMMTGILAFIIPLFAVTKTLAQNINTPHVFVEGLAGSESIAAIQTLVPVLPGQDFLWYGNIQGKAGSNEAWFVGIGTGYRKLIANQMYGGYLFLDRDTSKHQHSFYILNPGLEWFRSNWDFRVNGYIPVSDKEKNLNSFFLSDPNTCGQNGDTSFVEFRGHQQFEHRFTRVEEIGPGGDVEIGLAFLQNRNFTFHTGGYYFHLDNLDDIKGLEGRLEVPINRGVLAVARATYDNEQHGAIVAGLQIRLGTNPVPNLPNQLYAPVYRNISTVGQGSSVPIKVGTKDDGLFLRVDHIFFFTGMGGTAFDGTLNSGTFENPLSASEFNQATLIGIDDLIPGANLYLNTGTYVIPQTSPSVTSNNLVLFSGQSIYGRMSNFRSSATGDLRPLIDGEIDLFQGTFVVDSVRILNSVVDNPDGVPTAVIALDIEGATAQLCNLDVLASTLVTTDNDALNGAIAIKVNNSNVSIDNSTIQALAQTLGDNNVDNIALAIGSIDTDPVNTVLVANHSNFNSTAITQGDNLMNNVSIGIGNYLGEFTNNRFTLLNSSIGVTSSVNNNLGRDIAIGIGSNSASFTENTFALTNVALSSNSVVTDSNDAPAFSVGIGQVQGNFDDNVFTIAQSQIRSLLTVDTNNLSTSAVGLGSINDTGIATEFLRNEFTINQSFIGSQASIINNNANQFGLGIGTVDLNTASLFNNNTFVIEQSVISTISTVGTNTGLNETIALGNFLGTFDDNRFNITESVLDSLAEVINVSVDNQSYAENVTGINTLVNIARSFISSSGIVGGDSTTNVAVGLSSLGGTATIVRASSGRVAAIVNGLSVTNTATPTIGNVSLFNTPFVVIQDP